MRICIEGNIGSGKSTVIESLAWKLPGAKIHPEPTGAWGPLLERFYKDPASVAMELQLRVLLDFNKIPSDDVVRIVERSPLTCHHVFGAMAYQRGWLTDAQWATFKSSSALLGWEPDAIVFVDTPTDACVDRIDRRARGYAEPPEPEYFEDVRSKYETLLKFTGVPVVRVDGRAPPGEVLESVLSAIRGLIRV